MQKTEAIEMYLRHGYALFHLTGKAYPIKGWQNAKRNPFINPKKFTQNYGVNLQTDDLIIDVDVSKKKDGTLKKGRESLQKLIDDTGLDISKTFIVQTGTGGFHIYFKKPEDIQVKETWKRTYPDLEFKSRGRYVVGAECVHPDTLKNYIIKRGSLSDVHTAPTELLEKITYKPISFEGIQGLKKYTDDPQAISRAKKLLEMSNISVEGEGGDGQAYVIACRVRGFGVSPQMALDLMLTYWNDRCEPPWDVDELKTKVFNAYSYDTAPQGVNNPEIDFKDVEIDPNIPGEKDFIWATSLRKDNTRVKHIQNTNCYINLEFGTLLKYNLFTDEIEFAEVPSWYPADKTLVPWADNDAVFIKHHLATMQKYDVNVQGIHEAAI
ncbi:MAG: hypothetical protein GY928_13925, partial [Colwellia sp.]|nr:hypothetical protein [Colwellia sp.]